VSKISKIKGGRGMIIKAMITTRSIATKKSLAVKRFLMLLRSKPGIAIIYKIIPLARG
jgi:hypothetical protein